MNLIMFTGVNNLSALVRPIQLIVNLPWAVYPTATCAQNPEITYSATSKHPLLYDTSKSPGLPMHSVQWANLYTEASVTLKCETMSV